MSTFEAPSPWLPPAPIIDRIVRMALDEDVGTGDLTTLATVPEHLVGRGTIVAREPGVLCGLPVVEAVYRALSPAVRVVPFLQEGAAFEGGQPLAEVAGPVRALLTGERVALNFLQRLSGIATLTRRFVEACRGTAARITDTRKTTPGLRPLERYAVRVGGGVNHRFGLFDALLIKDNHIAAAGGVRAALQRARAMAGPLSAVEVEVRSLDELEEALSAGATAVLLDNMDVPTLRRAVAMARGRATLEASGGVRLDNVRAVAQTGVDYISVGALTHSAPAVDVSFELEAPSPPS